ncbi:sugar phosphate isomerase/epimerase family protein [Feifania hominis]|uniref:Sugar phosphate isomerase/epimerase n=1 Tax=Feifania hominis TaxID=2763660 RepID=A0A926DCD7_9FIRM|nr:TIM barrel protein [Feifania hominis]MBC8535988.1 sugar phosphate isomerase/epimerase [Feifania hominis]
MYTVYEPKFYSFNGDYFTYAKLAADAGIEAIGVPSALLDQENRALELARLVWELGLRWGIMFTPVDFYAADVDDTLFERGIETLKRQAQTAAKMGVRYAYNHIWSSNPERSFERNFDWHVRRIRRVGRIFEDNGIRYGLEFLGPRDVLHRYEHPFVHSIAGVCALADAAELKAAFLFDTYHWYCEGARLDDLYFALAHTDRMVGLHVNDAAAGRKPEEQLDMERAMPMTTGLIDAGKIYQLFGSHGYEGPAACEPLHPSMEHFQEIGAQATAQEIARAYQMLASR